MAFFVRAFTPLAVSLRILNIRCYLVSPFLFNSLPFFFLLSRVFFFSFSILISFLPFFVSSCLTTDAKNVRSCLNYVQTWFSVILRATYRSRNSYVSDMNVNSMSRETSVQLINNINVVKEHRNVEILFSRYIVRGKTGRIFVTQKLLSSNRVKKFLRKVLTSFLIDLARRIKYRTRSIESCCCNLFQS